MRDWPGWWRGGMVTRFVLGHTGESICSWRHFFSIDWSYNYWSYTLKFLRPEVYAMFPAWTSSTKEYKLTCIFTSCFGPACTTITGRWSLKWNTYAFSLQGEGREDAANIRFSSPRATVGNLLGRTWHPAWKGTDAQSRVTSGLSPCGLPGLAVSNILCDFEQVMPLFGFCVS